MLVEIKKINKEEKVIVSSLDIAETFSKRHSHVLRDIEKIEKDMLIDNNEKNPNLGSTKFNEMFCKTIYKSKNGKSNPMYHMTKDGFTLLVMGYTGKKAMQFKLTYISKFNEMENLLKEINTEVWKNLRLKSKENRKQFADVLNELVEYAEYQGSKNAKRYYQTYTKLINKKLGIECRDLATKEQLDNIAKWEELMGYWIEFYIVKGIQYKEIYKNIKKIVQYIADIEPFYDEKTLKVLD